MSRDGTPLSPTPCHRDPAGPRGVERVLFGAEASAREPRPRAARPPVGSNRPSQTGYCHVSVVLVAPTSHSVKAASFRPEIELLGETIHVLVEQVGAIDTGRLGDLVGRVTPEQQWGIDEALTTVPGLR